MPDTLLSTCRINFSCSFRKKVTEMQNNFPAIPALQTGSRVRAPNMSLSLSLHAFPIPPRPRRGCATCLLQDNCLSKSAAYILGPPSNTNRATLKCSWRNSLARLMPQILGMFKQDTITFGLGLFRRTVCEDAEKPLLRLPA